MAKDDIEHPGQSVLDAGLAFFGAVTASVTHEQNNVLSVIDQTAGLLQDMIAAEREGAPINVDRLTDAVSTVQAQTGRSLGIIRRLNRFAHSADAARVEFDLPEVLSNLVELCQRLAKLKYVRLRLLSSAEPLTLVGSPFFAQAAVFLSIRLALDTAERDDTIDVSAHAKGDGVLVTMNCTKKIDASHRDMAELQLIARYMNARVDTTSEGLEITFAGGRSNGSQR